MEAKFVVISRKLSKIESEVLVNYFYVISNEKFAAYYGQKNVSNLDREYIQNYCDKNGMIFYKNKKEMCFTFKYVK